MPSAYDGAGLTAEEVGSDQLAGKERAQRIVVGVDGSFGSSTAVTWAAAQARERDAILDLVAVWEELSPPTSGGAGGGGHLAVARERLERAVQTLARHRQLPERVISAPMEGSPGEQLVARAEGASLLVLGTTGISSPEIPGGIGLYCLRHSTAPVVFVPLPPER